MRRHAEPEEADAERTRHLPQLRKMRHQLRAGVMHGLDRRAGQFELPAGLQRDGAAAGDVEQADDVAVLEDRLPAEQVLHAFEQRADAAPALVRNRPVALDGERKLLVLGADAELRLRLRALGKPRDQFVARFYRRHVDLITSHEWGPIAATGKGPRPTRRRQAGQAQRTSGTWCRPLQNQSRRDNFPARALLKDHCFMTQPCNGPSLFSRNIGIRDQARLQCLASVNAPAGRRC